MRAKLEIPLATISSPRTLSIVLGEAQNPLHDLESLPLHFWKSVLPRKKNVFLKTSQ